jgi:hypothetical protein
VTHRPGFASRLIDVLSLGLVLGGAWLYMNAFAGMRELRNRPQEEFVRGETVAWGRLAEHQRLTRTSRIGLGIIGLGVVVGLSAAAHARQIARRRLIADNS